MATVIKDAGGIKSDWSGAPLTIYFRSYVFAADHKCVQEAVLLM